MARKATAAASREAILDAALRVASDDGLLALTLEKVAHAAGVSKGGLLYHFASKDELIRSLMEHFSARLEAALIAKVAADPRPQGRWVRAMVETAFPDAAAAKSQGGSEPGRFFAALVTAAVVNPALPAMMQPLGAKLRARMLAEPDGFEQLLTWLAIDGLFAWHTFGLLPPDDPLRERIVAAIRQRVGATAADTPATPRRSKT